jgi:signal transduction protein with GAF and PtsI domain
MFDQTHWLVPAPAAALGGTLLLALICYYFFSRHRLRARALQQEAVARMGQRALAGEGLRKLFNDGVQAVGRILQVEYCEVLELLPREEKLVMRATLPGIEKLIGQAVIEAGNGSQAGYTLQRREPVVMPDIHTESRFTPNYLMRQHGIVSGMSVVIEGRGQAFGVLNASSKRRRRFTENDINFLKSVANVLAADFRKLMSWRRPSTASRRKKRFTAANRRPNGWRPKRRSWPKSGASSAPT